MKKLTTIILLSIFISCEKKDAKILSEKSDDKLYLNYVAALQNESTFQYHLVVKIKNLNTGEVREVCTEGNFLEGALHREYDLDYKDKNVEKIDKIALENNERYFEFKNDSAIANLGVRYSIADLEEFQRKINFDSLADKIKKQKRWAMSLDDKEMMMYAHLLFNRGILTGEHNCYGGSLMYVDRKNPKF